MIDIAIVVVGINSREYVRGCLASLQQSDWRGYTHQTVYIDNASTDGSVAMVRDEFPGALVIANQRNGGFCAACNQGVQAVESRYVYLLNNDTIVFPDSLWPLAALLDADPRAGAAGNRLLNPDQTDQWSARRFPTWVNALLGRRTWLGRSLPRSWAVRDYLYKDEMEKNKPFAVDWIPGSCTLVRRDVYLQCGSLPEDMHYWSDALFCGRVRKLGLTVHVVPGARLIHYEGHGTGQKTGTVRRWLISDFHRGAYRFYCEHYRLGRLHPVRWLAAAALRVRGWALIAADTLRERAQSPGGARL